MLLLSVLLALAVFVRCIHGFLAVNAPLEAEALVLEGWVADYAVKGAVEEFDRGDYTVLYVTGGPLERGAPLSEYKTYAALGAAVAGYFGMPTNRIQAVPAPGVLRDRTYASAVALRNWLEAHDALPHALNLVTVGPHSRRSRLLYEKAFGDACRIGVIAVEDKDYAPQRWWAYSKGVRTVLGETVGYLYARFFFGIGEDRGGENESGEDSLESPP